MLKAITAVVLSEAWGYPVWRTLCVETPEGELVELFVRWMRRYPDNSVGRRFRGKFVLGRGWDLRFTPHAL